MTLRWFGRLDALTPSERALVLRRGHEGASPFPDVSEIQRAVRERGDDALRELTERFDGARIEELSVPRDSWLDAYEALPRDTRDAIDAAKENIERFHRACLPRPVEIEVVPGLMAGRRYLPIERIGVYVPGGRAAYPSTVLMCAVPARVAGVADVTVVTPPGPDGRVHAATLAACHVAGVDRVFAVGGAQAIFALAFGTNSVPRVDKIVGPGNAWVAAAKAAVAGEVAIDAPAGPSEVLVVADANADPALIARELLAQAEHDPAAASVAIVSDADVAAKTRDEVERLVKDAPRGDVVRASLSARGAVLVASDEDALAFCDAYAPEHLVILTREPRKTLAALSNYGSAFLGPWSSVALGDYVSGPNHVLPTMGLARAYSGLSVDDFLRHPTHQAATRDALERLSPTAERLAALEGLPNHAAALKARRERN